MMQKLEFLPITGRDAALLLLQTHLSLYIFFPNAKPYVSHTVEEGSFLEATRQTPYLLKFKCQRGDILRGFHLPLSVACTGLSGSLVGRMAVWAPKIYVKIRGTS